LNFRQFLAPTIPGGTRERLRLWCGGHSFEALFMRRAAEKAGFPTALGMAAANGLEKPQ
jgi:hypothetical protein